MAEPIGALRIAISASAAQFEADFKKIEGTLGRAGKSFEKAGKGLTRLGETLSTKVLAPIAAVSAALGLLAQRTASTGDAIAKNAMEAGISAKTYQELAFAFGQISQVEEPNLRMALGTLSQRLGEAAQGSEEMQKRFASLGLPMDNLKNGTVTAEQALEVLIMRLQGAKSASEATATASDFFGERVGRVLGPAILSAGADIDKLRQDAHSLGIVMSGDALAASEKYKDAMDVLGRQFDAVGRQIGEVLLPIMTDQLIPFIQQNVIPVLSRTAQVIANLIKAFSELPRGTQLAITGMVAFLAAAGPLALGIGLAMKSIAAFTFAIAPMIAAITGVGAAFMAFVAAGGPIAAFIAAAALTIAVWTGWSGKITAIFAGVLDWMAEQWNSFLEWITDLWNQFSIFSLDFWKNIGIGIWNAITKPFQALMGWTEQLTQRIQSFTAKIFEPATKSADAFASSVSARFGLLEEDLRGKTGVIAAMLLELEDKMRMGFEKSPLMTTDPAEIDKMRAQEEERARIAREADQFILDSRAAMFTSLANLADVFYSLSKGKSKALFNLWKVASASEAIVNAYAAANAALKNPPGPPYTIPFAAAALTMGLANAARISSMSFGGGARGGGFSSASAVSTKDVATIRATREAQPPPPLIVNVNGVVIGEDAWVNERLIPAIEGAVRNERSKLAMKEG